ncbi:PA3496 family putative envelope integrity protein [Legionella nagasakiensis]|uniref:PA3496 family putative envelope integrity protein n=1 Tax=Legionella nagasakiensis TaxID=535290 RepID=UPI001056526A|nr:hypothetical protein [Legionella nagasakiensis]
MSLHKGYDESQVFSDLNHDEEFEEFNPVDESEHKKRIRKMIEDRLERKRLREEFEDELDGEFDWDELER